jgi:N-acetylmuramoyl-L-alanine amidase
MILESAILCLALNVYHEARGEMIPGQYAVAHVTLNRAGGDAKRVCETVVAKHQFSWTKGMLTRKGEGRYTLKQNGVPKDKQAWALAKHIARYTLEYRPADITNGATFYHTTQVRPAWRKSVRLVKRMGRHLFYRTA